MRTLSPQLPLLTPQAAVAKDPDGQDDVLVGQRTQSLLERDFLCPLTRETLVEPVVTPCGHVMSKSAMLQMPRGPDGALSCPECGKPFRSNATEPDLRTVALQQQAQVQRASIRVQQDSDSSGDETDEEGGEVLVLGSAGGGGAARSRGSTAAPLPPSSGGGAKGGPVHVKTEPGQ